MTPKDLIEVRLNSIDDFHIIVETLTRIGIPAVNTKRLMQICFLLHKRGRYYICHYHELFGLDGFDQPMSTLDYARRNTIISLIEEWNLCEVISPERIASPRAETEDIRVLKHSEKGKWDLIPKYEIGRNHRSKSDDDDQFT